MGEHEAALRKYVKYVLSPEKPYHGSTARGWAFGAIDFACSAGLIDGDTYKGLLEEYGLIASDKKESPAALAGCRAHK